MKKTLTVNLGGSVYHIDEDAYKLLDNYLMNLRIHFRREESADEIVHDMELRISELFTDRVDNTKQVITIEDVEEVIAQMGQPEELAGEEPPYVHAEKESGPRKLYRDPDNKVIGGVAAGLAAYLGWDMTLVRIAFLVTGYFVHSFILVYIIAWIVIPLARTAGEKLAMKGEAVNLENIGKTVTDGFEKAKDYSRSDKPRNFLQRLGEGILSVIGFLVKFLLIVIAICCAPAIFALLVVCFALLMAATGILVSLPAVIYKLNEIFPMVDWSSMNTSPLGAVGLAVTGILIVGIPIIAIIHMLMRHFGGWQPMSTATRIVFIVLWLIALAAGVFFAVNIPFFAALM